MKAKLLGKITVMVAKAGCMPYAGLMLIAVGKRIAMTAELLMNVVNNVDDRAITKRNMIGESTIPENSF